MAWGMKARQKFNPKSRSSANPARFLRIVHKFSENDVRFLSLPVSSIRHMASGKTDADNTMTYLKSSLDDYTQIRLPLSAVEARLAHADANGIADFTKETAPQGFFATYYQTPEDDSPRSMAGSLTP